MTILDANRKQVHKLVKQPAPKQKAEFVFGTGGDPAVLVRHAAMGALTTVRGEETKTFKTLANFVNDDADRIAAIRALQRIPKQHWPKEEADKLVEQMLEHIKKIPVKDRTSSDALDALEFTDRLTTLLLPDRAKKVRAELGQLGVRVILHRHVARSVWLATRK